MPWLIVLLLASGVSIRMVALDNPTLSYHATRQYRSAIIARAMYQQASPSASEARKRCAAEALESQGDLEPSVTEWLSALGYRLLGREHLAVPRLLTTSFWVLGALLWLSMARRLFSDLPALVAGAFVLLLPFGVVASRSFQPDPLMVALLMSSIAAITALKPGGSSRRILLATVVTALAVFVKPYSGFLIGPALLARVLSVDTMRRWLTWPGLWVLLAVGLVAPASYYAIGFFDGSLRGQAAVSFRAGLWAQPTFWRGWREILELVFGLPALIAGLCGVVLAPERAARRLLVALWLGYFAYGMTFAYHISSHDYYQLPLVPVLALSWAGLAERGVRLARMPRLRWLRFVAIALGAVLLVVTAREIESNAFEQLRGRDAVSTAIYERVGATVQHSCRVVFIAADAYGQPLIYHGDVNGWPWPTVRDARRRAARMGTKPPKPRVQLRAYRREGAEFFVSTSFSELRRQPALRRELDKRYPVFARSEDFLIYDMRSRLRAQ